MTGQQILDVVETYERLLVEMGVEAAEHSHNTLCASKRLALAHLRSMFPSLCEFVTGDKLEKANRWLGFIQGVLWVCRVRNLRQMRDDNRTPAEESAA